MAQAPRQGMLRYGDLRTTRATIDTGTGTQRIANDPTRAKITSGRGNFVNWQEDLGISTTQPAAQSIRKSEEEFKSRIDTYRAQVEEAKSKVSSARGALNQEWGNLSAKEKEIAAAQGNIPSYGSALEGSWGQYKSTLTPYRIVEGEYLKPPGAQGDNSQENTYEYPTKTWYGSTYLLPKEVGESLIGKQGLEVNWNNGAYDVKARHFENKPVHTAFTEAQAKLEREYREKAGGVISGQLTDASGQINNAYGQLGHAKGQLIDYGAQVDAGEERVRAAEAQLNAALNKHQQEWDDIHNKYQNRRSKMMDILSSVTITKGKEDDSGN